MTALDVLGPTLRASRHAAPRSVVLAVLTAAAQHGIKPSQALAWLAARATTEPLRSYCLDPHNTQPLVRHVTQQTNQHFGSPAARQRTATARRLVGHTLCLPATGQTPAAARKVSVVAAWVGGRLLADSRGWDTTLVHGGTMGTALGIRQQTASLWLDAAEGVAITIRQRRVGGGKVVALRRLGKAAGLAAYDLAPLVADLADPAGPSSPLGVLLLAVDHPWVGHGVGHEVWLAQAAEWAGVHHPGVSGRGVRAARAAFAGCPDNGAELSAWLDERAEQSGAAERARLAAEARAEAVQARRESLAEARERSARTRGYVAAIMRACPRPDAPVAHRAKWLARAGVAAAGVPDESRADVRAKVEALLCRAGFSVKVSGKVAAELLGGE